MKENSKKTKLSLLALALALCLGIAGISAYFTDADTVTNTFTIGTISLALEEPNWNPDNAKNITPNEEIAKDPQVTNDGENDEYVYLTVSVPYANIVTANTDGTRNAAANTELFTYTVNNGWVEIKTEKDDTAGTVTHLLAYATKGADGSVKMDTLAKNAKTPAVFDKVTFVNAVEAQGLEATTKDIVVKAYGIQADNITTADTNNNALDIWEIISKQAASAIPAE